jgi:GNAT superfamily N-acetyltransferase
VQDAANRAVRPATAADVPELTRLRGLMLVSVGGDGLAGYLASMSTDPAHRGQGLGRRVLGELMAWFTHEGVTRVELNATEQAGSMYADVGFSPPRWPALR